jgi:HAD superfamily hydrolase (TIGR01490 family)
LNLALFDFDGTITTKDTFTAFLGYVFKNSNALKLKFILLIPILVAVNLKVISVEKAKEITFTLLFKGWTKTYFDRTALEFSAIVLPDIIRPIALDRIKYHKSRGDKIVVVSASLDSWVKGWCFEQEIETICSILETKEGIITGKLRKGDCNGIEKVRRIREKYELEEYDVVFAYGDSSGDKEMIDLADIAYYQWKEVEKK